MSDFEDSLRKQLAREAGMVQGMPRDLAARIAAASGPRPALWLRAVPVAVATMFVGALGVAIWAGGHAPSSAPPAPAGASSPSPGAGVSPAPNSTASAAASPASNLGPFACGSGATGGQTIVQPSADGSGNLTAVRLAHQAGYDRVTFEFAGATLAPYTITLQAATKFAMDASGKPVMVQGTSGARIVFQGASERDLNGNTTYTGSNDLLLAPAGQANAVAEARQVGDSERVLSWALGLNAHPVCTRVLRLGSPTRLVVDIKQAP